MMLIKTTNFTGVIPKLNAEQLPDNAAQDALDCNFNSGAIVGLRQAYAFTTEPTSAPPLGSLAYKFSDGSAAAAYSWAYDVDAIRTPVLQDKFNRFYWTGKNGSTTEFKFALATAGARGAPATSYKVGVIDNSLWDNNWSSLGLSLTTAAKPLPNILSQLTGATTAVYLCDEGGARISKNNLTVTTDYTISASTPDPVTGWSDTYTVTLATEITKANTAVDGATTYHLVRTTVSINNSSMVYGQSYSADVWCTSRGDIRTAKFVHVPDVGQLPQGVTAGQTVSIYHEPYSSHLDGAAGEVVFLGSFYVQDARKYKLNSGDTFPAGLTTATAATYKAPVTPAGAYLAFEFKFKYQDVDYALVATEGSDPSKGATSNVVDLPGVGGLSLTLTRGSDSKTFTIKPVFGVSLPTEMRSYVITWLNGLGEESEPSAPTELIELNPGTHRIKFVCNLDTFNTKAGQITSGRYAIHGFRLYRSATSSTGDTQFLYVGTISGAVPDPTASDPDKIPGENYIAFTTAGTSPNTLLTFYDDEVTTGTQLPTEESIYDYSELQSLQGLKAVHNGMTAAFKGNEVWVSEPYKPYMYTRKGIYTFRSQVKALWPLEQGFYVFLDNGVEYMSGYTPDQLMPQKLPTELACLNKNAVCAIGGQVAFISSDGPALINGMQVQLMTSFSREWWRGTAMAQATNGIRAAAYGHRVLMHYPGVSAGYLWDTEDGAMTRISERIDATYTVPSNVFAWSNTDELAFANTANYWNVFAKSDQNTKNWQWQSKTFTLQFPTNLGAMQLFGTGTVIVKTYVDGTLNFTSSTVTLSRSGTIIRLPSGFRSAKWSFRFEAQSTGTEMTGYNVATTITELQNA